MMHSVVCVSDTVLPFIGRDVSMIHSVVSVYDIVIIK